MSAGWLRASALVMIGLFSVSALAKDKPPTAIVVGGGLAGLTAAYELQNKGWQVTLLEAKPGMGGRSGMATSEWIGNSKTQPVLNRYLDTFKLTTLPAPEFVRTHSYLIDGEHFTVADLATKQPTTAEAIKRYEKTLDDLARSIEDPLNPQANSTLFALDQINVSTWLDKLQLPTTARQLINQQIRTRYDEPSRLSLLYFAQQTRVYRGVNDRDLRAARLPGGSPVLAQAFVKQLKTIKTSSPVSSISQDKDGVSVKVGTADYKADYVVVAVPLRALSRIQLTPGLDAQHMNAIKGTNYGWRDQMMLKFKNPVWESRARMSGEIYSNAGLGMLWIEPALKGGANVVINLSGDNARLLQAFGDKQMVDQVLIRLHAFYPQARGAFTGYEVRRYSTDAGTGGAYLAYGPGQISKYWRLWERPVQRITFAGEHTDALHPGTLEGALRSGQRAASQVQDLAAGKSFDVAKAAPVAAAAAAGAAVAGAAVAAKDSKPGFFARLFGWGGDADAAKPVAKTQAPVVAPVIPTAAVVAPVVAPAVAPAPAPAKPEPVKKASVKAPPVKQPAAKTEAAKKAAAHPAPAQKATAKAEPVKKKTTTAQ
ncbi:flavin monoamine oxidase family protein [Pseudomonas sp. R5(2019)]|uniref:flavin monoamine oxidase family protein n=1 Tax=Pseudomonas sp. R5(2019) TaxID=2697566 RepID=UPI001411E472|nr:flavin monoamine oxidase family protein [Pseudomonas sp. R5(2019)]NBA96641.1 FAD-dependent oxidoreductase [Pseudomonas sp. R5(2019)]